MSVYRKSDDRSTFERFNEPFVDDGRINNDDLSAIYPVNPVTGLPSSDISLIASPDTPESVRNTLTNRLSRLPSMSVNVDEETKLVTLRPRSCQSFAEVARFADFLQAYSDSVSSDSAPSNAPSDPAPSNAPSDPAPSDPAAS